MKQYVIALDQGTTSSRCILFDREQNIVGVAQREFTQIYPKPGWVEQDPMEIWSSQSSVLTEVLAQTGIAPTEVAAIGITNQRETTIVWDKATGRPIYNAIVWQCRRTAELVDRLRAEGLEEHIRAATGWFPTRTSPPLRSSGCSTMWRGPGKRPAGGDSVRHGGRLAAVEAHWRGRPRHRRHQRLPHHAL